MHFIASILIITQRLYDIRYRNQPRISSLIESLPYISLAIYVAELYNAGDTYVKCSQELKSISVLLRDWIRIEFVIFLGNMIGIACFLFFKQVLARFKAEIKHTIINSRSHSLTDALQRNYWNILILQTVVTCLTLECYLFKYYPRERQTKSSEIFIIAACVQLCGLLWIWFVSAYPKEHSEQNKWHIRARAIVFFALNISGYIILPTIAIVCAIKVAVMSEIGTLCSILIFCNTVFLNCVI